MQSSPNPKLSPLSGTDLGSAVATTGSTPPAAEVAVPPEFRPAALRFAVMALLVTALFGFAWLQLARDAARDLLHSYAVGIPVICGWLIWQSRPRAFIPEPARGLGVLFAGLAAAAAILTQLAWNGGMIQNSTSWLTGQMLGWVLGIWAAAAWCLGRPAWKMHGFAAAFLLFTVPFPDPMVNAIELGLQYSSAWTVEMVFRITDISYIRDARAFWIPGLRFEVAQECSGIRSTLVLFITSLVGGFLLLRSPWRRLAFSALVIPLGIARNTLRICTIALLTVHVDPGIIDSALHHRGGPLFFGISLIPLFVLLWWLRRQEEGPRPAP